MESLVDIFCPIGERVIKVVGRRVIGVTDTDLAALGMFDSRVGSGDVTTLYANVSWNELDKIVQGHVFSSGGAPNMFSMIAQYPDIADRMKEEPEKVYAFTLSDMAMSIAGQPENPPIRFVYHMPVAELFMMHGEKFRGIRVPVASGVEQITLENYMGMRFLPTVSNIGQAPEYKERGIAVPHWRIEATGVVPNDKQKPLKLEAQDAPFVEGWDPFLILAGVNFVNPKYNMIVFVGGRTPSTFAAELVAIGKDVVSREELEAAKVQTALSYIKLPEEAHHVRGVSSFLEETVRELSRNFGRRERNVAIVGMAYIKGGLPVRVSGPIDVRFYNPL